MFNYKITIISYLAINSDKIVNFKLMSEASLWLLFNLLPQYSTWLI